MHKKILKMLFFQITFFILISVVVAAYFKFNGVDLSLGPFFVWFVVVDIVLGIGIFVWVICDQIKKVKKRK